MNWKTERRQIDELKLAGYNPRQASEKEVKDLTASLDKFDLADPIIINKDNTIIGGHFRIRILKQKGITEVDVRVPERQLTPKEERELNIRLNKNLGSWDFDALSNNFEIDDLLEWGFDEKDLKIDLEVEEDDVPEVQAEAVSKLGEIYQLGNHRLMCGDSTKIEDVEKLMDGQKADMVFTDPPYGMFLDADFSGMKNNLDFAKDKGFIGGKKYNNVAGDHEDFNPEFINMIFSQFGYCKEILLWGANYYSELLINRNKGSWFVWDKRLEESADKMYGSCFELLWSKNKHKQDIARVKWAGVFGTEKEFDHKRHHPTQKPIGLSSWFINKFSKQDDIVLDLFGGSGSTLIACEQLNRKCFMMELDPKYIDVIIKRWENLTDEKAIKL